MLSLFKRDPTRRLRKAYEQKVQAAYQAQQNGNVRQYSLLTAEAEALKKELDEELAKVQ
ncbi:MAG: DUF6435 family protein [Pseudomonadota bacterium]